jgi:hypothetical protein
MPVFDIIERSLRSFEAFTPISAAISVLVFGLLESKARKHSALTDVDSFVEADIFLSVTETVTN